ncbi:MAG: radical SAM protein [Candidatus Nealsonbacteria bacterium]|nr:radical SAM protein [Candidatus Nealsonbacteria bacterium]
MDSIATHVAAAVRKTLRQYQQTKVRLQRRAFFCKALAGQSDMNVCVNSDLTVSCTCHDVDGSGHVGDLRHQSVAEVFSGETANRFRATLADGRLPTPLCARCCDLRTVDRGKAKSLADKHRLPEFIMMENTSACNLHCVSCPREKIRNMRSKVSMTLEDVTRVAEELQRAGVRRIGYLNQGEPFLSKNIGRELHVLRETIPGVWIHTSTNGQLIDTDEKREAALLIDEMQVSLDGIDQQMTDKYQRGLDFEKVYRNLKALIEFRDARGLQRPIVVWKYLLFRFNDRKAYLRRAIEMAREAKVDQILFERTVSPFYAVPWRSYLGLHNGIGETVPGGQCVVLR